MSRKPVTIPESVSVPSLIERKGKSPIVMITAYDAVQARIVDGAGADAILVGDSVGMTVLGYDSTIPVTLDDIIRHTRSVARGKASRLRETDSPEPGDLLRNGRSALLVADMPFGTYGADVSDGVRAGVRLMAEGNAHSVKLEGSGPAILETIRRLVDIGVPVMGHLGLTPQSIHRFGGFKAQGKTEAAAEAIVEDATALVAAGVWGIVLEMIPAPLAKRITQTVPVPTIGIGAGIDCDGQVQVFHDLMGITFAPVFKHTRRYTDTVSSWQRALAEHVSDIRERRFPEKKNSL